MATGKIKFFKKDKGFGFILGDDGKEYFFHVSKVKTTDTTPSENTAVTFSTRTGKKGEEAFDIVLTGAAGPGTTVSMTNSRRPAGPPARSQQRTRTPGTRQSRSGGSSHGKFPYTFARRSAEFEKKAPERLHDHLATGCYDIAFEVDWQALTPVAANPCSDPSAGTCHPVNDDNQFQGYDKRWLMVNGRLALSPFTVKSAIANGFASLLGSCYRVEKEVVKHEAKSETFQCTGAYKRYRIDRKKSKPGLLEHINHTTGEVRVIPVTEFLWDNPEPPQGVTFTPGETYEISYTPGNKNIITGLGRSGSGKTAKVVYYDRYRFGMNLSFGPGTFKKNHFDRFYKIEDRPPITGRVNLINLEPLEQQKEKVFMGVFKKFPGTENDDGRDNQVGEPWHQDLGPDNPEFQPGKWVYYQTHKDNIGKEVITAIGLNFQFKTAFHLHDDAVPFEQRTCTDLNRLCPRCAMFGIAAEDKAETVGLHGRFKAAVLVGPEVVPGKSVTQQAGKVPITLQRWLDKESGAEIAGQFLLPIQGQAKASKRNGGYYDYDSGMIAGAKRYLHATLNYPGFQDEVQRVNSCRTLADYHFQTQANKKQDSEGMDYSHPQRNYAMVCRDGLNFSGTLGAENCSVEEIAALLLLLNHQQGGHGFKIGLGKAMGLGSMTSSIRKVWLRKTANAPWQTLVLPTAGSALSGLQQKGVKGKGFKLGDLQQKNAEVSSWQAILGEEIDGLKTALADLETIKKALNLVADNQEGALQYPPPGGNYWKSFPQPTAG